MANSIWRVKFDVPHKFAVEPGFARAQHCHNFRQGAGALVNTWRDANTGALMLLPSFLRETWYSDAQWKPLTEWTHVAANWQQIVRGRYPGSGIPQDLAHFWSTVVPNPSGTFHNQIETLTGIAVAAASLASALEGDVIKWALESQFQLARDEGFVWHYTVTGDEMHRPRNWFALAWDDWYLHFSYDGTVRVYEYSSDNTQMPELVEEFTICTPGDIINKHGYFVFLPVPGFGLSIYHSHTAQQLTSKVSSAQAGVTRGHLIQRRKEDVGGYYVHDGGKLRVGIGAFIGHVHHTMGYHAIRFPTGPGPTFLGEVFDPGFKPTFGPAEVSNASLPIALPARGSLTLALRNGDDSADWTAGTDQKGRVKVQMSTTDARYSPVLLGTYVRWSPILNLRDTTPVSPDSLHHLEFSEDDEGRFSGTCRVLMKGQAQRRLVERGDTTFLVERSDDNGATWHTQGGGLAQLQGAAQAYLDEAGFYYLAEWKLGGMEARFEEITQTSNSAFDSLTPGQAINAVLHLCGFETIDPLPVPTHDIILPPVPNGQEWRFGTRAGENGQEIIKAMLLFYRSQYEEWRLRYDWPGQKWKLEKKPRDMTQGALWTLTPFQDEVSTSQRKVLMADGSPLLFRLAVSPPEVNLVQPFGLTKIDPTAERVPGAILRNEASIWDKTSMDYLGRVKGAQPLFAPLGADDIDEINKMGLRVFTAAAVRRLQPVIPARDYVDGLRPGVRVVVRGRDAQGLRTDLFQDVVNTSFAPVYALWVKRRTVTLDYNNGGGEVSPTVEYGLDSVWESMV